MLPSDPTGTRIELPFRAVALVFLSRALLRCGLNGLAVSALRQVTRVVPDIRMRLWQGERLPGLDASEREQNG